MIRVPGLSVTFTWHGKKESWWTGGGGAHSQCASAVCQPAESDWLESLAPSACGNSRSGHQPGKEKKKKWQKKGGWWWWSSSQHATEAFRRERHVRHPHVGQSPWPPLSRLFPPDCSQTRPSVLAASVATLSSHTTRPSCASARRRRPCRSPRHGVMPQPVSAFPRGPSPASATASPSPRRETGTVQEPTLLRHVHMLCLHFSSSS